MQLTLSFQKDIMTDSRLPSKVTYGTGLELGERVRIVETEEYPDWIFRLLLDVFTEVASPFYYLVMIDEYGEVSMDIKINGKYALALVDATITTVMNHLQVKLDYSPYIATYKLFPENYYEDT